MKNAQSLPLEAIKTIPFFDVTAWAPGRSISNPHFFVGGEWHCWFAAGNELRRIYAWPAEANYFGDAPERETDQSFRLLNLIHQRASYPEMYRASDGIWNDFQNFATSLAKINLFYETSKRTKGTDTVRFVQTEIEYIVMVGRGVYDLLQEMIAAHWERITLFEPAKHKRSLPKSFADMALKGDTPRTSEELQEKYGLPKILADWYVSQTLFFKWLRLLRNQLAHGGHSPVQLLFCTERGYAIHREEKPWCDLYDWPKDVELPNGLVPIRPAICAIIHSTVLATESIAEIFERTIQFPKELFPGLKYFSRGYHDREYHQIGEVLRDSWWCETRMPVLPPENMPQAAIAPKESV